MEPNGRELDENATVVSSQERILRDGRQNTAASSVTTPVEYLPIASQSLKTIPQETDAPVREMVGEDTFGGSEDSAASEERLAPKILPTCSHSSAWLEDIMRNQFQNISFVVKATVVRLFRDAGRAAESSPDTKIMTIIGTVGNRSVTKGFQSTAFQASVKNGV